MECPQLFCKYCGLIGKYSVISRHGESIAQCNGCGAYIKNISTQSPKFFFGKFKGIKVSNVLDLDYLVWYLENIRDVKFYLKQAIQKQITLLTKHDNPMKYFLHDTNSMNDEKITELYMEFGYEGVGLFYAILEKIGAQEKPIKTAVLKRQLNVGKKLEKIWDYLEEIGLISSSNGETFNVRLLSYGEKIDKNREKDAERKRRERALHAINQVHAENVTVDVHMESDACPRPNITEQNKTINISFDLFWNEYGKKEGRREAEKKWERLTDKEREEIIKMLPTYKAKTPNLVYRKNPATFLNQKVWEDDAYQVGAIMMGVLKATRINENDQIVYENGKIYGASKVDDIEAFKKGEAPISIFDRKIS